MRAGIAGWQGSWPAARQCRGSALWPGPAVPLCSGMPAAVRAGGAGGQQRAAAAPRLPRNLAAAAGGAGNAAVPQ